MSFSYRFYFGCKFIELAVFAEKALGRSLAGLFWSVVIRDIRGFFQEFSGICADMVCGYRCRLVFDDPERMYNS
ncbi:MAG: hypothetical protein CSA20_07950 [Deltaproteobacteria bacterium]|nr:MAG: hypothetical protein CSA20_07950 [Deltaproteobacteria bacterium]